MKFLLAGACVGLVTIAARAQEPLACADVPQDSAALAAAEQFSGLHLRGKALRKDLVMVTRGLRWHKLLPAATKQARAEDKPIVWIQALGDIKGFT